MRIIPAVMTVLALASPAVVNAQTFSVHGSGGLTRPDAGHSLSAGVGFSPTSRLSFNIDFERTHIASRIRRDDRGTVSAFRGGTLSLATAELRVSVLGRDRVGPYALAGMAAGISRPNVTPIFQDRVTNEVRAPFFGGGIEVPLGDRVSLFGDVRMMLVVGKENDELFGVVPIRGGVSFNF
jgi:hypothetical protein